MKMSKRTPARMLRIEKVTWIRSFECLNRLMAIVDAVARTNRLCH